MKKTLSYEVLENQYTNTSVKENITQLTYYVCKLVLKCKKIVKKVAKNTSISLNFPLLKCFLVTHNFLDWYGILTTQTRLVCTTFSKKILDRDIVWRRNKPPKFTIIQKCLHFELWIAPKQSKKLILTWKFYHNN